MFAHNMRLFCRYNIAKQCCFERDFLNYTCGGRNGALKETCLYLVQFKIA